jgi:hypothetical protein
MQIDNKQYRDLPASERSDYDHHRALTVKLPYAHYIAKGWKTIEIRKAKNNYRGKVVICSSQKPLVEGMQEGAIQCEVEIYDCIPVSQLTLEQWDKTFLAKEDQEAYSSHYGWMLRNPRRLIEIPAKGKLGFWKLIIKEDEFVYYPDLLNAYREHPYGAPSFTSRDLLKGAIRALVATAIICGLIIYFIFR